MKTGFAFVISVLAVVLWATVGTAQQTGAAMGTTVSPILTVESDRFFEESDFGKRVARQLDAARTVLLAENRKIEAELTDEEESLAEKRKTMTANDFQAVADAFDERVQKIRSIQDAKAQKIVATNEEEQATFVNAARPVLTDLMRNSSASVILERRSLLLSSTAIDVTDLAIENLNAAIGDGAGLSANP